MLKSRPEYIANRLNLAGSITKEVDSDKSEIGVAVAEQEPRGRAVLVLYGSNSGVLRRVSA